MITSETRFSKQGQKDPDSPDSQEVDGGKVCGMLVIWWFSVADGGYEWLLL